MMQARQGGKLQGLRAVVKVDRCTSITVDISVDPQATHRRHVH